MSYPDASISATSRARARGRLVRDDEFPLSLFYSQLKPRLEPVLERPLREATPAAA